MDATFTSPHHILGLDLQGPVLPGSVTKFLRETNEDLVIDWVRSSSTGHLSVVVVSSNQFSASVRIGFSGTLAGVGAVDATNLVSIAYPGSHHAMLPGGISFLCWFLSDAQLADLDRGIPYVRW